MNLRVYAAVLVLVSIGLGIALFRERATSAGLAAQNTRLARQIAELRYEARQAAKQAEKFGQRAVELDSQLGTAKSRTTATESRQFQLTRELSETQSRLTEREQREVALMAELEALRQKAAAPASAPAGDIAPYRDRIAGLEQQLTQLLTRALAESPVPAVPEAEAAPAPYQVVRTGPRDAFVVMDYGAGNGASPGQILGLWRGTTPVARVQISDARPRFSLAQVLPGTLKGQLQTGDLVLLTH